MSNELHVQAILLSMKAATNKLCFLLVFLKIRTLLEKKHVSVAFLQFISKAEFLFVPPIIICQV